ncbi:MAG: hydrolase TatD [Candidatus Andersenbacteria bacterium CG10_big_fil_rev_8_21_14_0_10_54_11]|uniref:Hydrolase TatD n=1 Tax=Candidatus Andersenbacteria bacterium CG10_big_fil_rev_8_21_14_0_10_54_11 TaxID=1974485 RepID=A0A2M6X033_9BACT|nr:MAG: hydrolase TatD [Candidatus Andersenbacteria bacterium CG10_big_fil_rev_8_21_14_0_10_54_11]
MIDSHAHVSFGQFDADRGVVIARARAAGVGWIEVGTDAAQSRKALALAEQHPADILGASVGVHPIDAASGIDWADLHQLLDHPRVLAVGEVGLDYYRGGTREQQLPVLEQFVALAHMRSLPVIFHVRDALPAGGGGAGSAFACAHDDVIAFLEHLSDSDRPRGVIHTFSGSLEQARRYLALGMYVSFSGVVTFKNAGEIADAAREMPLERMLVETDCPFLAPEPYRGKRNEPSYLQYTAQRIADLRGVRAEDVIAATEHNTRRLFGT